VSATQTWDPERYARNARFVSELGAPVVELLAPRAGERILDLGCGDGALTAELVARGCAVVGVDASPLQVEAARRRGLDARVADGQHLDFTAEFDAVFSNAALHWMTEPARVVAGVWRALRPGGRFVGEMGGRGNTAHVLAALRGTLARQGVDASAIQPWYFPGDDDYRTLLEAAGFAVRAIALIPRPTPLPGDIGDWLETFAESFLAAAPDRAAFVAAVRDGLRPALCDAAGRWSVDYVRLRFAAEKPR
jgi:trans-aconitate methyltransferase